MAVGTGIAAMGCDRAADGGSGSTRPATGDCDRAPAGLLHDLRTAGTGRFGGCRNSGEHRTVRVHGHRLFFRRAPLVASIRSVSTGAGSRGPGCVSPGRRPSGGTEAGGAPAGAQDHQGFVI